MARQINAKGLRLIGEFEGERLTVYLDPVGKLTVGVGHLVTPADKLRLGDKITKAQSEAFLARDLAGTEAGVTRLAKATLSGNEFSALVSLAFNIGLYSLGRSSVLHKLNSSDRRGAADAFLLWCKGGRPLRLIPGLLRRRQAERKLFLEKEPN